MKILYANQYPLPAETQLPPPEQSCIFLAGPTPREDGVPSWRPEAIRLLEEAGFEGTVLTPEDAGGGRAHDYVDQIEWEEQALDCATVIMFWIPRELEKMPGFTTNIEWGEWYQSGKVVLGAPYDAPKMRYLLYKADKYGVPVSRTLPGTVEAALGLLRGMVSAGPVESRLGAALDFELVLDEISKREAAAGIQTAGVFAMGLGDLDRVFIEGPAIFTNPGWGDEDVRSGVLINPTGWDIFVAFTDILARSNDQHHTFFVGISDEPVSMAGEVPVYQLVVES